MESKGMIFGALLVCLAISLFSAQGSEASVLKKKKSDFGTDEGFGNWLGTGTDNKVTSNKKPMCRSICQYNEDCCRGYKCKRNFLSARYGYCARYCTPAGPGEDCRRCQSCSQGYICTVFVDVPYEQQYRCIRRE